MSIKNKGWIYGVVSWYPEEQEHLTGANSGSFAQIDSPLGTNRTHQTVRRTTHRTNRVSLKPALKPAMYAAVFPKA